MMVNLLRFREGSIEGSGCELNSMALRRRRARRRLNIVFPNQGDRGTHIDIGAAAAEPGVEQPGRRGAISGIPGSDGAQ